MEVDESLEAQAGPADNIEVKKKKKPKRGIIYLSSVPPFYNVSKIKEVFGECGTVRRVFLQPQNKDLKKRKKSKKLLHFSEGWVEFERKSVAKKVASQLNNTRVDPRKKSKQYDCLWTIKYLTKFKWIHLNARLAYEQAYEKQKLRDSIDKTKAKTSNFASSIRKNKKPNLLKKD